jgi:hypothetical protein
VQVICFWMIVALVVLAVFLAAHRLYRRRRLAITEGPESILSQGEAARLARQAVADFFNDLGDRFRPAPAAQPAERIRQIYTELLALGAALRRPRAVGSTPLEFLPEMHAALPESISDLDAITAMYLKVRYGEYSEAEIDVPMAESAWKRVAASGAKAKKALPPLQLAQLTDQDPQA